MKVTQWTNFVRPVASRFFSSGNQAYPRVVHPKLVEHTEQIYKNISGIMLRSFVRGITGALVGHRDHFYRSYSYSEVQGIVTEGLTQSLNEPLFLRADHEGLFTSKAIFREMGFRAYWTKKFIADLLDGGKEKLTPELVGNAIFLANSFAQRPKFQEMIAEFNLKYPGHQAYDLREVLKIQEMKKREGRSVPLDMDDIGSYPIVNPTDEAFTRWLIESFSLTERQVAARMFNQADFIVGSSSAEIASYEIGTGAGAGASALTRTLIQLDKRDQLFMGFRDGIVWVAARLAIADNNQTPFYMSKGDKNFYSLQDLINNYARLMLQVVNEMLPSMDGHLHKHPDYFYDTPRALRLTFDKAIEVAYTQSIPPHVRTQPMPLTGRGI